MVAPLFLARGHIEGSDGVGPNRGEKLAGGPQTFAETFVGLLDVRVGS